MLYKNYCLYKVLVGISLFGVIFFIFEVYEGLIFDKDVFKKIGILNKLYEGDFVMVGWGFNIWDLLLKKDIVIFLFLGDKVNLML